MGVGDRKTYELTYFDIRGRAEPIRMLFALANVPYKDTRIGYDMWAVLKPKTPFGQLPILEMSGGSLKAPITLCQTNAIERYLSKEFGLAGRTLMETTKIDMILECMRDGIQPITLIFNEKNDNKKSEVLSKYSEEQLPHFLDYLTGQLSDEWFLDQISLADIAIYVAFDNISMFVPDFLDSKQYWKLREWRSRFESHPRIHQWLKERPVTAY